MGGQQLPDLRINTMEMLQQLGDAHLLANKSTFDEIKRSTQRSTRSSGEWARRCASFSGTSTIKQQIPTKGKLLFMSK